jgi:predicted alpha/beta superfamily hydrolase
MKRIIQGSSILILVLIFFAPVNIFAQDNAQDVVIGKIIQLDSKVLGEKRQIMVYLPPGYDQTSTKYPVLYLLDGRTHFQHASSTVQFLSQNGRIPQMIIVAIVNIDRTRDFTPTTIEDRPQSGGIEKFITYLKDELFPYIEENYRIAPYRLLEGHSLGGMFSIHVLFNYPKMFQAHFAMSPYIMWDDNYVLNETTKMIQDPPDFSNFLYITLGDEENYVEPLGKFTKLLETKMPNGLVWHYTVMENDNHGTVPLKSLYNGLETLYENWGIEAAVSDQSVKTIEDHYKKLSAKYDYNVEIPENVFNVMGYRAIGQEKIELALEFFLHNVTLYPESANVYDSLGEGYEAAGKLDLAKKNYAIAVKKGAESGNNNLAIYKEHLDKVTKKLSDSDS